MKMTTVRALFTVMIICVIAFAFFRLLYCYDKSISAEEIWKGFAVLTGVEGPP